MGLKPKIYLKEINIELDVTYVVIGGGQPMTIKDFEGKV